MTKSRQSNMRAVLCLLLVTICGLGVAPISAEATPVAGQTLREALVELNSDGLRLVFSSELVKPWMRVVTTPGSDDPLMVAREILGEHNLELTEGPGDIWIVTRRPNAAVAPTVIISGQVVDADTGLGIIGAVLASNSGSVEAERAGRFSISAQLPLELEISADGYEAASIEIASRQGVRIALQNVEPQIDELTVLTSRYVLFSGDQNAQFSHDEIDRLPHLADDLARAIAKVPAAAANDFSARFSIRGGWSDEVTMRLDGLDLADPFHIKDLQGSFSIVDSNLVERVDILPGGFSASYGNSSSGIVDIVTLHPEEASVFSVGISFVSMFANSRGSFNDGEGGWLISVRRGYMDWVFDRIETGTGEFRPRFADVLGKIEHSVGERHTVAAQFLMASDDFYYQDDVDDIRVDGKADSLFLWARLESHWSAGLVSELVLWRNEFDRSRDNFVDVPTDITATLLDIRESQGTGLRYDWRWRVNDRWQIDLGAELRNYQTSYDYSLTSVSNSVFYPGAEPIDRRTLKDVDGGRRSIYTSVKRRLGRLTAELGWRWDAETYTANEENISSPRMALTYEMGERTRLTASWGKYQQFQAAEALQVEDGVEEFFPATRTEHLILGLEHRPNSKLSIRAEAYQKTYQYLRPRFTNLFTPFKPIPEAVQDRVVIPATSAEAYGIELTLKQQAGRFSWIGSYALSDVTDRVNGADVPRDWNQRHSVDVTLNWQGSRWNFNLASRWHSGWPRTDATLGLVDTSNGPAVGVVPGERNAGQNKDYFRVDTRISRDVEVKRGEFTFYLEIFNLFDTENTCCIEGFDLLPGPELSVRDGAWLPLMPSFGFAWTF